jgi:polyisoprenoid-binding protein YceI
MKIFKSMTIIATVVGSLTWANELKVDVNSSSLRWFASKVTGKHDGAVKVKNGSLKVVKGVLQSGKVVLDMTTITVRDIENPEYNAKLVGHLNSPDFFEVDKFKSAVLLIESVKQVKGEDHTISGKLMIKGYTHPVNFPAKIKTDGESLTAQAKIEIDRTLWKIQYGSASFFKSLGDKAIHNEVQFEVDLTAK